MRTAEVRGWILTVGCFAAYQRRTSDWFLSSSCSVVQRRSAVQDAAVEDDKERHLQRARHEVHRGDQAGSQIARLEGEVPRHREELHELAQEPVRVRELPVHPGQRALLSSPGFRDLRLRFVLEVRLEFRVLRALQVLRDQLVLLDLRHRGLWRDVL